MHEPLEITLRHLARSGFPVVALDDSGTVVFWSDDASRTFSVERADALGHAFTEIVKLRDARGGEIQLVRGQPCVAFFDSNGETRQTYCAPLSLPDNSSSVLAVIFYASEPMVNPLTNRELEVVQLLSAGIGTADMAGKLGIAPTTVRNHVQNILRKLGLHSRIEVVAWARRQRLLNNSEAK